MFKKVARFFSGEVRLRLLAPPFLCANLFILSGIPCFDIENEGTCFLCSVSHNDRKAVETLCRQKGVCTEILYEKGFFSFVPKALRRPGLILGVLLGIFCLFQSTNYVWDVQISGNESLSEERVFEILENYGFRIGCRHSSLDLHQICNRIPMENDEIAWITVNMMGSVAEIELVETRNKPATDKKEKNPVNLVAKEAGEILRFELSSGRAVTGVGQTVKAGDLLVAGYSEKETGLHPRASSGRVYARVLRTKQLFIPYEYTVKTESEPILLEKSINILGKGLLLHKNKLKFSEEYGIIEDEYRPTVLGIALPLRVQVTKARVYTESTATRTKEEALQLGRDLLIQELRTDSSEILSLSFKSQETENGITLYLTAECIANIAEEIKIISPEGE